MAQPTRAEGSDRDRDRAARDTRPGPAKTQGGNWDLLADSLNSTTDHQSGPNIPGYQILGEIGRGGMGLVYKARQIRLERIVALKVILTGAYASMIDRVRFRREAEAVAKLQHPNIVQIFDVGEAEGNSYMSMEFVDGGTLEAWQSGKPQSPRTSAAVIACLARAVQHAHDAGVIHRDLKPANILISKAEGKRSGAVGKEVRLPFVPKVTDFGLAKHLDGGMSLTATGVACGTPNYMPPEQVRKGTAPLGPQADVYALGGILYELLSGRPPFSGYSPAEIMTLVLSTDAVNLRFFRPDLPVDVTLIVERCLEKDPARRYPTAAALADDLEKFAAGEPISSRPPGPVELARRWAKKNRGVAAALGVFAFGTFVLAIACAILFLGVSNARTERDAALGTARKLQTELDAALKGDKREDEARLAAEAEAKRRAEALTRATVLLVQGLRSAERGRQTQAEEELTAAIDALEAIRKESPGPLSQVLRLALSEAYYTRGVQRRKQTKTGWDEDFRIAERLDPDRKPPKK